jgi:hypothetical protein
MKNRWGGGGWTISPGRDRPAQYRSGAVKEFLKGIKYFLLTKREERGEREREREREREESRFG